MPNYKSIGQYTSACTKSGLTQRQKVKVGQFFAFSYNYEEDENNKELPFYDKKPLAYIYKIKDNEVYGLNLHHIPIKLREDFIKHFLNEPNETQVSIIQKVKNKIRKLFSSSGKAKRSGFKEITKDYAELYAIFSKTDVMVRHYKKDEIVNSYAISNDYILELSKYFADTYHHATYKEAMKNYSNK